MPENPMPTTASRPCQLCGKAVPQGAGVVLGDTGVRVCVDELGHPLEELATLLTRSSTRRKTTPLTVG